MSATPTRVRQINSAGHSNSPRTGKSFGDCQTPKSGSSLETTQQSISPRARRRPKVFTFDEESLCNSIVQFDSQLFASNWRQVKNVDSESENGQRINRFAKIPTKYDDKSRFAAKSSSVNERRVDAEFPRRDFLLKTSDLKTIGANKELLAMSSRLLQAEFLSNEDVAVVDLPFRFEALMVVVGAIYKRDSGEERANLENVDLMLLFEVFEVATFLNIQFLVDSVGNQLFQNATPSTYVSTYHQLKVFCAELAERLWSKIVGEFHLVCFYQTHKLLTALEIKRALIDERINIKRGDENEIMRTWIKSNRSHYQSSEYQLTRRMVNDQSTGSLGRARQRVPYSGIFALGGWGSHGPTDRLEVLNGYTESWTEPHASLGELTSPRCYYAAVPMPEAQSVYIMGGFDGNRYYDGSTRFNLQSLTWDDLSYAPMHERRCYVNSARLDSTHILACGGYNNVARMANAEILDTTQNAWTQISPMSIVRSDAHAVELEGKVYVIGGFDGHACHRTVEYYDPNQDQWTVIEGQMRDKRSGVSALSLNGALITVGGFTGRNRLNSTEFYDPREGVWHSLCPMITRRSNFGISSLRGDPIVVGGYDGHGTTELSERFDWRANKWVGIPPLRHRRSALSLFRVDNLDNMERLFAS